MPTIDVDGATVAYEVIGTGAPVVVLHSSASSKAQWRTLRDRLAEGHRVLAVDLYGYGGTDPWPGMRAIAMADEVRLVAAAMAAAGMAAAHLVGHSYGGAVALELAATHPKRAASLVAIEPVAFHMLRQGSRGDALLVDEIADVVRALTVSLLDGDHAAGMARFVNYWNGPDAWTRFGDTARKTLCRLGAAVLLNFRTARGTTTKAEVYSRLGLPTTVISGTESPRPVRRIAELLTGWLPGAGLEHVIGAGHMAPLTHADQVDRLIATHLMRQGSWRDAA